MRPDILPRLKLAAEAARSNLDRHLERRCGTCFLKVEPFADREHPSPGALCKVGSFLFQVHRAAQAKVEREKRRRK